MKKNIRVGILSTFLGLILGTSFLSCNKTKSSSDDLKLDTISMVVSYDSTFILNPEKPNSPYYIFSFKYDYPSSNNELANLLDKNIFGDNLMPNLKQSFDNLFKYYVEQFKELNVDMAEDESDNDIIESDDKQSYTNISVDMIYRDANIVSYKNELSAYNYGSAHPAHQSIYYSFDLSNNKQLKEEDIFIENYQDFLNNLILEYLKMKYNVRTFDELVNEAYILCDEDEIKSNGNFYIKDSNLIYCFNEYEIAAYAAGSIEVAIPLDALSLILKADSPINYLLEN